MRELWQDPHDPRRFDHYVVIGPDGTVQTTKMVLEHSAAPEDSPEQMHVLLNNHGFFDFNQIQVDPALVRDMHRASLTKTPQAFSDLTMAVHAEAKRIKADG